MQTGNTLFGFTTSKVSVCRSLEPLLWSQQWLFIMIEGHGKRKMLISWQPSVSMQGRGKGGDTTYFWKMYLEWFTCSNKAPILIAYSIMDLFIQSSVNYISILMITQNAFQSQLTGHCAFNIWTFGDMAYTNYKNLTQSFQNVKNPKISQKSQFKVFLETRKTFLNVNLYIKVTSQIFPICVG